MILKVYDGPFFGPVDSDFEPQEIFSRRFEHDFFEIERLRDFANQYGDEYFVSVDFESASLEVRREVAPEIFLRQLRWAFSEQKMVCFYNLDSLNRWIVGGEKLGVLVTSNGKTHTHETCILPKKNSSSIRAAPFELVKYSKSLLKQNFGNTIKLEFITQDTLYFVTTNQFTSLAEPSVVCTGWL